MLKLLLLPMLVISSKIIEGPWSTTAVTQSNISKPSASTENPGYGEDSYLYKSYSTEKTGSGSGSGRDDTDDTEDYYLEPEGYDLYIDDQAVIEENEAARNAVDTSLWFSCDRNKVWLTKDKKCDGNRDCFDCSDEINCKDTSNTFFYCYGKGNGSLLGDKREFSSYDPFCIPRAKFCDGEFHCMSRADEKQYGQGFKCELKNRFRTCVLPDYMICDSVVDCKDGSDVCTPEIEGNRIIPLSAQEMFLKNPFRCLYTSSNIAIFQHQVCDGIMDCPDLSDECLCEEAGSEAIHRICSQICWQDVWSDSKATESCMSCKPGQAKLCYEGLDEFVNSLYGTDGNCDCVDPSNLCSSIPLDFVELQAEICQLEKQERNLIECLSIDGSFSVIRGQLCDGRPECFFGEDECSIECWKNETNGSRWNEHFCSLLINDAGYFCDPEDAVEVAGEIRTIIPCDGKYDCDNKIDEQFCPTRFSCNEGSEVSNGTTRLASTYDINQVCDGRKDCEDNSDEDSLLCYNARKHECSNSSRSTSRDCKSADVFFPCETLSDTVLTGGYASSTTANSTVVMVVLQYGLLVVAAVGTIGNMAAFVIAILNAVSLARKEQDFSFENYLVFTRESFFYVSVAIAKAMFNIYLAVLLLYDPKDEVICTETAVLRTDETCSSLGSLAFISSNATWFVLLIYLFITTAVSDVVGYKRKDLVQDDVSDGFLPQSKETAQKKQRYLLVWVVSNLVLEVLIVIALVVCVIMANVTFDKMAWATIDNAPSLLSNDILNKTEMITLSDRATTLSGEFHSEAASFSWQRADEVMETYAPSLGFRLHGIIGYFSYGALCLPLQLAKPVDETNENSLANTFMILNSVICLCCLGLTVVFFWAKRNGNNRDDKVKEKPNISVADVTVAETAAWLPIFISYYLNFIKPGSVNDQLYQTIVLVSLSLNCGIISIFLLLRKRSVKWNFCTKPPLTNMNKGESATMLDE